MFEEYIIYGIVGLKIIMDIPFLRKRIITDTNMLNVFKTAKESISDSNNIKIDVKGSLEQINTKVDDIEKKVYNSIIEMNNSVLAFQEDELYQKMLVGLSELDELHQTLQNKDSVIERLETDLKETKLLLQEVRNLLKG